MLIQNSADVNIRIGGLPRSISRRLVNDFYSLSTLFSRVSLIKTACLYANNGFGIAVTVMETFWQYLDETRKVVDGFGF